jgi:hypothetical protein
VKCTPREARGRSFCFLFRNHKYKRNAPPGQALGLKQRKTGGVHLFLKTLITLLNLRNLEQTRNNVEVLQTFAHYPKWQAAIHILQQIPLAVKKI